MEFFDVVRARQSIRAFADQPIDEAALRTILDAANCAPSAGNFQAYEIFVVRRASDRVALAKAAPGQDFLAGAPVLLVFCAHPARAVPRYGQRATKLYAIQDATIACTQAMLAVTALGLATVWIGAFRDDEVRRAIRAPEELLPVAMLPVGYPAEKPVRTSRRLIEDLVHEMD